MGLKRYSRSPSVLRKHFIRELSVLHSIDVIIDVISRSGEMATSIDPGNVIYPGTPSPLTLPNSCLRHQLIDTITTVLRLVSVSPLACCIASWLVHPKFSYRWIIVDSHMSPTLEQSLPSQDQKYCRKTTRSTTSSSINPAFTVCSLRAYSSGA